MFFKTVFAAVLGLMAVSGLCWECARQPAGTSQRSTGHMASSAEIWCAMCGLRMTGEMSSDTSDEEYEEHNVENFEVVGHGWSGGVYLFLEDWELARVALSCRLALDFLCQEIQEAWYLWYCCMRCPLLQCFESLSHPGRAATVWSRM